MRRDDGVLGGHRGGADSRGVRCGHDLRGRPTQRGSRTDFSRRRLAGSRVHRTPASRGTVNSRVVRGPEVGLWLLDHDRGARDNRGPSHCLGCRDGEPGTVLAVADLGDDLRLVDGGIGREADPGGLILAEGRDAGGIDGPGSVLGGGTGVVGGGGFLVGAERCVIERAEPGRELGRVADGERELAGLGVDDEPALRLGGGGLGCGLGGSLLGLGLGGRLPVGRLVGLLILLGLRLLGLWLVNPGLLRLGLRRRLLGGDSLWLLGLGRLGEREPR